MTAESWNGNRATSMIAEPVVIFELRNAGTMRRISLKSAELLLQQGLYDITYNIAKSYFEYLLFKRSFEFSQIERIFWFMAA